MKELIQALAAFSDCEFHQENHEYVKPKKGLKYRSVTTLIGSYGEEFDEDYWSVYKALEGSGYKVGPSPCRKLIHVNGDPTDLDDMDHLRFKVKPRDIRRMWKENAKAAQGKGSYLHEYAEKAAMKKYSRWREPAIDKHLEENDHLITVRPEMIVCDDDLGIAGQLDLLVHNTITGGMEIHDWKTDKKIVFSNEYQKMKPPLDELDACNWNKYVIQLNTYAWIIENNSDLRISDLFINHITPDEVLQYKVPEKRELVKKMMHDYRRRRTKHA